MNNSRIIAIGIRKTKSCLGGGGFGPVKLDIHTKRMMVAYRLGMINVQAIASKIPEAARLGLIPDLQNIVPFFDKASKMTERQLDKFIFKYDEKRNAHEYPFFDKNGLSYEESAKSKGLYRRILQLQTDTDIDPKSYEYGLRLLLEGVSEIIEQLREEPQRYSYSKSTTDKIQQARKHWVEHNQESLLNDALSYIPISLHRDIDLLWDGIEGWQS